MTRLALTALILAVAALTRSPEVVAWVLVVVSAVWLASYYLTRAYRAHCEQMDRDIARVLTDTEDPTALARAVGYHCLPLLTEERVRAESAPLVIEAEWAALNGDAS
jgi:hypothetical protein